MTNAQTIFCNEYLIDLNATRAYKVAYPNVKKEETINAAASRLLKSDKVSKYIQQQMKAREERTQITQDKVLQELANVGFFNIKDLYDEQGRLKEVYELTDNVAKAISSIKVQQKAGALQIELKGEVPIQHIDEQVKEIKTYDKVKALEDIGRHLGMFTDKLEITKPVAETLAEIDRYIASKQNE